MTDIAEVRKALEEIVSAHYGKCPFDNKHFNPGSLTTPCPVCGDIDDSELPETDPRKGKPSQCHRGGASARARSALAALSRMERSAAPERKRWRHVNSGALVTEIGRGLYASGDGVDDITPIVFYRHDIGRWGSTFWSRSIKEFEDGQFVEVPPTQTEEGKT
jgi:hypothetical protein